MKFQGKIINPKNQMGVSGCVVEVWMKNVNSKAARKVEFVGNPVITTDQSGEFIINETPTENFTAECTPFLKVFNNDELIQTSENIELNELLNTDYEIKVDSIDPEYTVNSAWRRIYGKVTQSDGTPCGVDYQISAYLRMFGRDQVMTNEVNRNSTILLDADGNYTIEYSDKAIALIGEKAPDIFLKVEHDPGTGMEFVMNSPLFLGVPNDFNVNLVVDSDEYIGKDKYSEIRYAIDNDAELRTVSITYTNLQASDVEYLSSKLNFTQNEIRNFFQAEYDASLTSIQSDILFGLYSMGVPKGLGSLIFISKPLLEQKINMAADANLIPAVDTANMDVILGHLKTSIRDIVVANQSSEIDIIFELADITIVDPTVLQQAKELMIDAIIKLIDLDPTFANTDQTILDIWNYFTDNQVFPADKVARLKFIFELLGIVENNFPLLVCLGRNKGMTNMDGLFAGTKKQFINSVESFIGSIAYGSVTVELPEKYQTAGEYITSIYENIERVYPTQALSYGTLLNNVIGQAGSAAAIADADNMYISSDLHLFLNTYKAELDLRFSTVEQIFEDLGVLSSSYTDFDALKSDVKALQRVLLLTPQIDKFSTVLSLWNNAYSSAVKINSISERAFVDRFASKFVIGTEDAQKGVDRATAIYQKSQNISSQALMTWSKYDGSFNTVSTSANTVYGYESTPTSNIPNLDKIFGPIDYCTCKHCESILGPSAYLADLLKYIDEIDAQNGDTLLDVLKSRRKDLTGIKLNCENTNIPVPHIDLVIEILEQAVQSTSTDLVAYDTTWDEASLKAFPEHIDSKAYDGGAGFAGSKNMNYPWNLPYNLWVDEYNTYLQDMGFRRGTIMERIPGISISGTKLNHSEYDVACSKIGILKSEADYIKSVSNDAELCECYGVDHLVQAGDYIAQLQNLTMVSDFLKRTSMSFEELEELLQSRYISPDPTKKIIIDYKLDDNNVKQFKLSHAYLKFNEVNLNASLADLRSALEKIHRFARLRNRIGWSVRELDLAIDALGFWSNSWTEQFFIQLASLKELTEMINQPKENIFLWFDDFDIREYENDTPLYNDLFLNNAYVRSINSDNLLVQPNTLKIFDREVKPTIIGALQISEADLELIGIKESWEWSGTGQSTYENASAYLSNLSKIFRIQSFAKALDISIIDYYNLKRLLNRSLVVEGDLNPSDVIEIIKQANTLLESPYEINELLYLFFNESSGLSIDDEREEELLNLVETIRNSLNDYYTQLEYDSGSKKELLSTYLDNMVINPNDTFSENDVNVMMDIIEQRSSTSVTNKNIYIDNNLQIFTNPAEAKMNLVGTTGSDGAITDAVDRFNYVIHQINPVVPEKRRSKLKNILGTSLSEFDSKLVLAIIDGNVSELPAEYNLDTIAKQKAYVNDKLSVLMNQSNVDEMLIFETAGDPTISEQIGRYDYVMKHVVTTELENIVINAFCNHYAFDFELMSDMLKDYISDPSSSQHAVITRFINHDFIIGNEVISSQNNAAYLACERIHKVVSIISEYDFDVSTAIEYNSFVNAGLNEVPSIWNMPVGGEIFTSSMCSNWLSLDRYIKTGCQYFGGVLGIMELLNMTTGLYSENEYLDKVLELTGWNEESLRALTLEGLFTFSTDILDVEKIEKLVAQIAILEVLKIDAETLIGLNKADNDITADNAQQVRQIVKNKYELKDWMKKAPALRKPIRERQRDALLTCLISTTDRFEDEYDVYNHYLIDPKMSACAMTSRIKQAGLTVQLFVQRVLMNLESPLSIDEDHKDEWIWRKNYRVWEANKKIFLYPENWLEPELRKYKTPFFEELESQLMQDEPTEELVETLYMEYLEKLDKVALMEVVTFYEDKEENTIHVLARTKETPHEYYYRKWIEKSFWTPWEKVDTQINGEFAYLFKLKNRLFLGWFEVNEEKNMPETTNVNSIKLSNIIHYTKIRFAWVEYNSGTWSKKKTSKNFVDTIYKKNEFNQSLAMGISKISMLHFIPAISENKVTFRISRYSFDSLQFATSGYLAVFNGKSVDFVVDRSDRCALYSAINPKYKYQKGVVKDDEALVKLFNYDHQYYNDSYQQIQLANPETADLYPINLLSDKSLVSRSEFQDHDYKFPQVFMETPNHLFFADLSFSTSSADRMAVSSAPKFTSKGVGSTHLKDLKAKQEEDYSVEKVYGVGGSTPNIVRAQVQEEQEDGYIDDVIGDFGIGIDDGSSNTVGGGSTGNDHSIEIVVPSEYSYKIYPHYHPFTDEIIKHLNTYGVDGLFNKKIKVGNELVPLIKVVDTQNYKDLFKPDENVICHGIYGLENKIDFSAGGAYSLYNWELFFHTPMLIADRLYHNQKFEEAQKWMHYIFDPTNSDLSYVVNNSNEESRFWRFSYLAESNTPANINDLLLKLANGDSQLERQVKIWREDPFNPHVIAQFREVAYMKSVIMKYLDIIIAWADKLFAQDSMESINQAAQLYIIGAQLLGKRPTIIEVETGDGASFDQIGDEIGPFGNTIIELENLIAVSEYVDNTNPDMMSIDNLLPKVELAIEEMKSRSLARPTVGHFVVSMYRVLYFGIPFNDKMLTYWDKVEDRLFKIRHCMNIKGIVRQLPMFQPPIDPGMLAQAVANGVNIGDALNDMNAPLPHYRYRVMYQKALEFCNDVKSLGGALLSALEKQDAEKISLLRASHEIDMYDLIKEIKVKAIEEAEMNIEAIDNSRLVTTHRKDYYDTREERNSKEKSQIKLLRAANTLTTISGSLSAISGIMALFPEGEFGISGVSSSPVATFTYGGANIHNSINSITAALNSAASVVQTSGSLASIEAGFERRWDDWQFQKEQAEKEITHLDKQKLAAQIRKAMAEKELSNHEKQKEHSLETYELLEDKFTNQELYQWMVGELSNLYFHSYQEAYNLAKRAENTYRYELGIDETSRIVEMGHWDNLKQGLLAGEKLHKQLKQLDLAYMENNERQYELTKHFSLAMINPSALNDLKAGGRCDFNISELLYDLDHPGQYMRRIKSVSVTIPAVTGPYTNVNCRLSLSGDSYRRDTSGAGSYAYMGVEDPRFVHGVGGIQAIATSSGQNDHGIFEFNFNDERYLPFEGAGAISSWIVELPDAFRQFDYDTISDVILTINYTAKEGGDTLRAPAEANINDHLNYLIEGVQGTGQQLENLFSMKAEFANEFYQLTTSETGNTVFNITKDHFPYFIVDQMENKGKIIKVVSANLYSLEVTSGQYTQIGSSVVVNQNLNSETGLDISIPNSGTPTTDDIIMILNYEIN